MELSIVTFLLDPILILEVITLGLVFMYMVFLCLEEIQPTKNAQPEHTPTSYTFGVGSIISCKW